MGMLTIMNKHLQRYLSMKGIRELVFMPVKNGSLL